MSDTITVPPAPYARELSRALWFRQPATRCRFLFAADDPAGLVIAPLGPKGVQTLKDALVRLMAAERKVESGAMLVDGDGDAVFCLAGDPAGFLRRLAGWASRHVAAIPALGNLHTAGAAGLLAPLDGDAAIEALDLKSLTIVRDAALWQDLLRTDDAAVAAVLADRRPGERMWFWMSADVPAGMVPLLLQPVTWDPNRDRLDAQLRQLEAAGAGAGVSGYAYFTEENRLQFVARGLALPLMIELAGWVAEQLDACPALARLANCQFVRAEGGIVREVLEEPTLWEGLVAPPGPDTLAAAAAALAALEAGGSLWLWVTAAAPGCGFLALGPVAGDEAGVAFEARLTGLYRRFPEAHQDAATGTVTRDAAGGLAIAWHGGAPVAATLAAVARQEAGLAELTKARIP